MSSTLVPILIFYIYHFLYIPITRTALCVQKLKQATQTIQRQLNESKLTNANDNVLAVSFRMRILPFLNTRHCRLVPLLEQTSGDETSREEVDLALSSRKLLPRTPPQLLHTRLPTQFTLSRSPLRYTGTRFEPVCKGSWVRVPVMCDPQAPYSTLGRSEGGESPSSEGACERHEERLGKTKKRSI